MIRRILSILLLLQFFNAPASIADTKGSSPAKHTTTKSNAQYKVVSDEANTELYAPVFIPNSDKIAVVKKSHEPDFHEAEAFADKEMEQFHTRTQKDPRWSDPRIVIVSAKDESKQFIGYGWSPEATADGKLLFYIRQVQPISGKRILAEPQKGNQLYSFDLSTNKSTFVAGPTEGYLDSPTADPTGKYIAYALCNKTNGDWGGQVGIGIYDIAGNTVNIVLAPQKHFQLFDLVTPMFWVGSNLIARVGTPCSKGVWLADKYSWQVLKFQDKAQSVLFEYKEQTAVDEGPSVSAAGANQINIIGKNSWQKIDAADGKVKETLPVAKAPKGTLSNDGKYMLIDKEKSVQIQNVATGKSKNITLPGQFTSFCWAQDSKKLAIVVTKEKNKGGEPVFDRDCLLLIDIPNSL